MAMGTLIEGGRIIRQKSKAGKERLKQARKDIAAQREIDRELREKRREATVGAAGKAARVEKKRIRKEAREGSLPELEGSRLDLMDIYQDKAKQLESVVDSIRAIGNDIEKYKGRLGVGRAEKPAREATETFRTEVRAERSTDEAA